MIVAFANYLQHQIHVYFASTTASPLKYSPQLATLPSTLPILIAFYEPGHYWAVTVARSIGHDSQKSPPDNKSGNYSFPPPPKNKFDDITSELINYNVDIVGIIKTWLARNSHLNYYKISGYTSYLTTGVLKREAMP